MKTNSSRAQPYLIAMETPLCPCGDRIICSGLSYGKAMRQRKGGLGGSGAGSTTRCVIVRS